MTPRRIFVTGTDTGVGKTRVATGICRHYVNAGQRVAAMKPVASGCALTPEGLRNDDALALAAAINVRASYLEVNPYAFAPPVAPHIAAELAGVVIDFARLDHAFERLSLCSDVLVVEGAGGWLVPLDAHQTFADLADRWQLDVVLVVGLRLGCLNHALLTADAIARRGRNLLGWVANPLEPRLPEVARNIDTLCARLASPCLGSLAFAPAAGPDEIAAALRAGLASL